MMKKIFNGCLFQCTTNGVKKKKERISIVRHLDF